MTKTNRIHEFFLLIWILFIFLSYYLFSSYVPSLKNSALLLLISANLSTFIIYGIDKIQARSKNKRVPEIVLYTIALLGGSIGAIIAMKLFRHKTAKRSFQLVLSILLLVQLFVILYYLGYFA